MGGHVVMTDTLLMDSIFIASIELGNMNLQLLSIPRSKSKFRGGTSTSNGTRHPQFNQLYHWDSSSFDYMFRFIGRGCQWLFRKPRPPLSYIRGSCGRRRERERHSS
jgi:hypothetical protein